MRWNNVGGSASLMFRLTIGFGRSSSTLRHNHTNSLMLRLKLRSNQRPSARFLLMVAALGRKMMAVRSGKWILETAWHPLFKLPACISVLEHRGMCSRARRRSFVRVTIVFQAKSLTAAISSKGQRMP